jgi:nitroreductase
MEVFDVVCTALAIRKYKKDPIPNETIHRIVEAAQMTGNSQNAQPWHFIVVENPDMINKLASLVRSGPYINQAPLAVVVAIKDTRFAESDASRAIQSMILTAWAEGVGSNWTGFYGLERVNDLLDIPEDLQVLAVIPFGYPNQPTGKGLKRRKPLSDIAHREKFGQPFE